MLKVEFSKSASRVYVSIFDRLPEQSSDRTLAARVRHGSAARTQPTEARLQASHQLHATTSPSQASALSHTNREVSAFDRADQHRSVPFALPNHRADPDRLHE